MTPMTPWFHRPRAEPAQRGVVVLGAPLESGPRFRGARLMPAALRDAGLDDALRRAGVAVADLGDLEIHVGDHTRDAATGVLAYREVCAATEKIREGVPQLLDSPDTPLVIGGCCGILVGIVAALRERYRHVGLAFVDGHLDFYDAENAPDGALADMTLAVLTRGSLRSLTTIVGGLPLVHPDDVWVLGFRDHWVMRARRAPDALRELPEAHFADDADVRHHGPVEVGRAVSTALADRPGRFWLHVALDVLSSSAMPAVYDTLPGGLDWDELTALLRPVVRNGALLGLDVAGYDPGKDPGRRCAARVVRLLADVLGGQTT